MKSIPLWRKILFALVAGGLAVAATQPASAGTVKIGTEVAPSFSSHTGNGPTAQTFIAPPGATRLLRVGVANWAGAAADISVKRGLGSSFTPISPVTSFAPSGPGTVLREAVLPAGGIAVTAGETYFIESSTGTLPIVDDYYTGGELRAGYAGKDTWFFAEFEVPEPVPTVSEWVMIAMGAAFAGTALLMLARRRGRQSLAL